MKVSNASLELAVNQINTEPVWPGSAALFTSSLLLQPGGNVVTITVACGGKRYKKKLNWSNELKILSTPLKYYKFLKIKCMEIFFRAKVCVLPDYCIIFIKSKKKKLGFISLIYAQ